MFISLVGVLLLLPPHLSEEKVHNGKYHEITSPRHRHDLEIRSKYGVGSSTNIDTDFDDVEDPLLGSEQGRGASRKGGGGYIFSEEDVGYRSNVDKVLGFVQYIVSGVPGVGVAMNLQPSSTSSSISSSSSMSSPNMTTHHAQQTINTASFDTALSSQHAATIIVGIDKPPSSTTGVNEGVVDAPPPLSTIAAQGETSVSSPPLSPTDKEWIRVNEGDNDFEEFEDAIEL